MKLNRFEDVREAEDFSCIICCEVALAPTMHDKCRNIICNKCQEGDPHLKCHWGQFGENAPLTLVELNRREKKYHAKLKVKCFFCQTGVPLESLFSHSEDCPEWPIDLQQKHPQSTNSATRVSEKSNGIIVVSDPPNSDHFIRPHRQIKKVEFYHEGRQLRSLRHRIGGHAEEEDSVARLYYQDSKLLPNLNADDLVLNKVQHRVLDKSMKIKDFLRKLIAPCQSRTNEPWNSEIEDLRRRFPRKMRVTWKRRFDQTRTATFHFKRDHRGFWGCWLAQLSSRSPQSILYRQEKRYSFSL